MTFAEKVRKVRKLNKLTQAEFAASLGISRGNYSCLETEKVFPTPLLINCISLLYGVDKAWLADNNNEDLRALNNNVQILHAITEQYDLLNDDFKCFAQKQISDLLELQNTLEQK